MVLIYFDSLEIVWVILLFSCYFYSIFGQKLQKYKTQVKWCGNEKQKIWEWSVSIGEHMIQSGCKYVKVAENAFYQILTETSKWAETGQRRSKSQTFWAKTIFCNKIGTYVKVCRKWFRNPQYKNFSPHLLAHFYYFLCERELYTPRAHGASKTLHVTYRLPPAAWGRLLTMISLRTSSSRSEGWPYTLHWEHVGRDL